MRYSVIVVASLLVALIGTRGPAMGQNYSLGSYSWNSDLGDVITDILCGIGNFSGSNNSGGGPANGHVSSHAQASGPSSGGSATVKYRFRVTATQLVPGTTG